MNKIIFIATNQVKDARSLSGGNTVPLVDRCANAGEVICESKNIGYDGLYSLETRAVRSKFEQKVDA